ERAAADVRVDADSFASLVVNTRESRPDTMRGPPSISSTKGTEKKSNARPISSWTIEKRRSPNTLDDFSIPFINSRLFSLVLNPRKDEHGLGLSGEIARARR